MSNIQGTSDILNESERTSLFSSTELLARYKTQSELDEESKAKLKKIDHLILLAEKVHTKCRFMVFLTIKVSSIQYNHVLCRPVCVS